MLKSLKELWERAWSVIGGFLSLIARLFGHYPPVPQTPHENITTNDIAEELDQARQKQAAGESKNLGLETSAALIWGYANTPARSRAEVDLGSLPENQRNTLLLMSDLDLARLAGNHLLCMQWHVLDGKFPKGKKAQEVPALSKEEVVSNQFMARLRPRHSQPDDGDDHLPSYGYRM